jgi:tetratricopeptide (TPR) repeat protein
MCAQLLALPQESITFNLASAADTIVKTMVAVLTIIAAALVIVGLIRAWVGRRRVQVVIEDVAPVEGLPPSVASGLSPQLRQAVRKALLQQRDDASYSVLKTLEQDINGGLLRARGSIQVKTITTGLRSTTEDSLTTLAAGVRAVAPKEAEGLLSALSAALPAQRGWVIRAKPVLYGADSDADTGIVIELAELGHPPDAVTTFWTRSETLRSAATDEARTAATISSIYRLIDPVARWVAIRLVSRQLAQAGVPRRWQLLAKHKLKQELAGLQMQLAGQLSLYATRNQTEFNRGFAEQALADLSDAARLLPQYFRPHLAAAAVHELLGWSYKLSRDVQNTSKEFTQSVRAYDEATRLLREASDASPDQKAALERIAVRRTKCRLLSGDRGQVVIGAQELVELCRMTGTTALELYNGACLFAVAIACPDIPGEKKPLYVAHAWLLLGRSLLADGVDGPWGLAMTDIELESMDASQRTCFCDELKSLHPTGTPLSGYEAFPLVRAAMSAIGISPPAST